MARSLIPRNSVIVGADIVAVNDVTGVQYSTKTNGEGIYVLPNLPPGPYRLQVSKFGFKTIIKPDITLNVQDALAINFTLPVGSFSEIVTVEGGAPASEYGVGRGQHCCRPSIRRKPSDEWKEFSDVDPT